jgi:hypothetical protein
MELIRSLPDSSERAACWLLPCSASMPQAHDRRLKLPGRNPYETRHMQRGKKMSGASLDGYTARARFRQAEDLAQAVQAALGLFNRDATGAQLLQDGAALGLAVSV